ncbi:MAG: glycosyltransferase family 4 protein [Candidatus Babeliales bacterium]
MMSLKSYFKIGCFFLLSSSFVFAKNSNRNNKFDYFELGQFSENFEKNKLNLPRILHVNIADQTCGGAAQVVFALCLNLLNQGYPVKVVAAKNSHFHKELKQRGIPCYGIDLHWPTKSKATFSNDLTKILDEICHKDKIDILHVHKHWEYKAAKSIAHKLNIAAVAFYHSFVFPDPEKFRGFDAVMLANPSVAEYLNIQNTELSLGIKNIEFICPPHNDEKFLKFVPTCDRKTFFKNTYGIDVLNCPVICMIANFYECKNHRLLFKAVHKLIYEEKIPVQVMLAGSGTDKETEKLKKIVSDYGIEKNVLFLGYTSFIPDLLFHSDIKILPSKGEAFGIVLMEAALMKKAIIVSKNSGAAGVLVNHEVTGLVIDPNDVSDLVLQIKKLIQNPDLVSTLGMNAYNLACTKFTTEVALQNVKNIYHGIWK